MVNYIFVRTLAWPLPTMTVHVGIAVLGTAQANELIICKGSSQQVLSVPSYGWYTLV